MTVYMSKRSHLFINYLFFVSCETFTRHIFKGFLLDKQQEYIKNRMLFFYLLLSINICLILLVPSANTRGPPGL
jgi:hypothetical protein